MKEESANLASTTSAHVMTFYRNGISIPYQMNDSNDGGILRVRGTSESNCELELATWDDSGGGETIKFNYYPTTSTVSPTYSVSVPKKSGTLALTSDIPSTISWSNVTGTKTTAVFEEKNQWLNPARLQILRPNTTAYSDRACVGVTDGNLHIDCYANKGLYLNYYSGSITYFQGTNQYVQSTGFYSGSDRRLKKDIQSIPDSSLERLYDIAEKLFKSFIWKKTGKKSYGLIAQQIREYIPEAISYNNDGIMSINYEVAYAKLIASLIYKIKAQEKQISMLLEHVNFPQEH